MAAILCPRCLGQNVYRATIENLKPSDGASVLLVNDVDWTHSSSSSLVTT